MALNFQAWAVVVLASFLIILQAKVRLQDMLRLPVSCPEAAIWRIGGLVIQRSQGRDSLGAYIVFSRYWVS
jgi:hypothetical protein